ncbi:MAG: ATP-binding protein [Roseococcus sp.]
MASSGEPVTENVIEQIADGLVLRDPAGKIILTNRRFAETYGLASPAEAVGKSFPDILDLAWGLAAAAEEAQRCWVDNARFPGAPFELPLPGDRWVRVREHRTHGGSLLGTHVDLTDHHRLRRSEAEARQRAEELAARLAKEIEERERVEQQMIQAARLASLGEMATGLAHELNQPLAGISMAAENAQRTLETMAEAPSRLRDKLSLIVDLTQRAAAIIDHIRIFGRSETAGRGPVAIGEVLTGAERLLANRLLGAGVRLRISLAPEMPQVLGTSVPLEQVIMSLIGNACDAYARLAEPVPAEGWEIGITAGATADWVTIEVQDAAGGIPPEVLPRIFEPFFTTKPVGQGPGLGLSISYGIITEMGGTITAENAAAGCLIRIRLPVAQGG